MLWSYVTGIFSDGSHLTVHGPGNRTAVKDLGHGLLPDRGPFNYGSIEVPASLEILNLASLILEKALHGGTPWPDDEWYQIGDTWDLNLWINRFEEDPDEWEFCASLYPVTRGPDGFGHTNGDVFHRLVTLKGRDLTFNHFLTSY